MFKTSKNKPIKREKGISSARRAKVVIEKIEAFAENVELQCSFCRSKRVAKKTLTCKDCGTTAPRNYGANQRRDKHGNAI